MTNDVTPCPECGGQYPMHSMECAAGQGRAAISVARAQEASRAAFEAHFDLSSRQAWQHQDGRYKDLGVQKWWEGWEAGRQH